MKMGNASLAYEILLYLNSFYFGKFFHYAYYIHDVFVCMGGCLTIIRRVFCVDVSECVSAFNFSSFEFF